jgi:hypothetical protein
MAKIGGLRGLAIAVIAVFGGIAMPASSFDFPLPKAPQAELTSATSSQEVMFCVDWETKEVKYSKYWRFCPNKHADIMLGLQGPQGETGLTGPWGPSGSTGATGARGPAGATTSLWDSLSNCYQKVQAAIEVGFVMPLKTDREYFENASGCIVEQAKDTSRIELYRNMGLPVVTDWEILEIYAVSEGDGFAGLSTYAGSRVRLRLTIENGDTISALNEDFRLCLVTSLNQVVGSVLIGHEGEGKYVTEHIGLKATPYELTMKFSLGYTENEHTWGSCTRFNYFEEIHVDALTSNPSVILENVIHVDPAQELPSDFDEFKSYWGW